MIVVGGLCIALLAIPTLLALWCLEIPIELYQIT